MKIWKYKITDRSTGNTLIDKESYADSYKDLLDTYIRPKIQDLGLVQNEYRVSVKEIEG